MFPIDLNEYKEKIDLFISDIKLKEWEMEGPLKIKEVSFLGIGTGNLNIKVKINDKNFVFRFCINRFRKNFFLNECAFFKFSKDIDFFPKMRYCEKTGQNLFNFPFMVLDYIEGDCLINIKYEINERFLSSLAFETSRIHKIGYENSGLEEKDIFRKIHTRMDFLKEKIKNEDYEALSKIYNKMRLGWKDNKNCKTLIHGNIWEGNIIKNKEDLRLIDYEKTCIDDPALEIAHIFHDFKTGLYFSEDQKDFFIKEYKRYRDDETIKDRVDNLLKMDIFYSFLRIIEYSILSKEETQNELFKSSIKKYCNKEILNEYFNKLKDLDIIDKDKKLENFYSSG